jgi:NAD+ diphosphatase
VPDGGAFVVWRGRVLIESAQQPHPLSLTHVALAAIVPSVPVLTDHGAQVVAHLLDTDIADADALAERLAPGAVFADPMFELGRYDAPVRHALMRAIAVERWSNRYRFCPACARPLHWTQDAVAKICTHPERVHRHFPRLDPAIIVLVTNGDRALLGRAARFPPGFYSTLAGFVEPGESVEAAVRREVYEEAGIRVGATRYFGSESWPFPRSLMLGFFAQAESETITLRDAELEDARWFDRRELRGLQDHMKTARPFFDTIARRLIDHWLT